MPGELGRLGPVSSQVAGEAARSALDRLGALSGGRVGVRWVAVDDHGQAVAVTGTGYTAPPLLRAVIDARDRTCRFPGCTLPADRCDCDHNEPFPSGPTSSRNTCCLCRTHHRLKTHSGWRLAPGPNGALLWTSPLGRQYRTHPGLWAEPVEPPDSAQPSADLDVPADPAESWTDAEYQAWADRLCRQAEQAFGSEPGNELGQYLEATGPDLPPTWWAEAPSG
jgi:hypothetical protein